MKKRKLEILFRCDGSPTIGIGHIMRCLALADEFRATYNLESGFALKDDRSGVALVRKSGYSVFLPQDTTPFDYDAWLRELVQEADVSVLILDVRDDLPQSSLRHLSESGTTLVTIDDPSDRRLSVDLAFYPPVSQVGRMDWTDFAGRLFAGWEWIPLRRDLAGASVDSSLSHNPNLNLLVTTGGADSARMALKIVEFLNPVDRPFNAVFVAGPACQHYSELARAVAGGRRNFSIERDPESLPRLMAEADLAIASFGVTAYELAALGVPAIYLCATPDHQESASAFVNEGIGISLGLASEVDGEKFRQGLLPLLDSSEIRRAMSQKGKETVDGKGASRISKIIVEYLEERSRE